MVLILTRATTALHPWPDMTTKRGCSWLFTSPSFIGKNPPNNMLHVTLVEITYNTWKYCSFRPGLPCDIRQYVFIFFIFFSMYLYCGVTYVRDSIYRWDNCRGAIRIIITVGLAELTVSAPREHPSLVIVFLEYYLDRCTNHAKVRYDCVIFKPRSFQMAYYI